MKSVVGPRRRTLARWLGGDHPSNNCLPLTNLIPARPLLACFPRRGIGRNGPMERASGGFRWLI